ncbi:MAG: four helix bundle protein [Ignavibacteria bacterium RBG_16_35_7]|nr:MAG: four helix bundle protein [Ignavibacteria bacterium RBG_16_35_7]
MDKSELEERLINFAVFIIEITNGLSNTKAGNHLADQLVRSGTSHALNYGEAQNGESRKDFIHKIKIVLKELRETSICLKIIERAKLCKSDEKIHIALKENDELISIFVKSVETAQRNMDNEIRNSKINRKS